MLSTHGILIMTSFLPDLKIIPILYQTSDVLPSNFEDVATGVLKVLNNLALLDIKFMQRTLVSPFDSFNLFWMIMAIKLCFIVILKISC